MTLPSEEIKAWFLEHGRVAMVGTNRRNAGPNMSPLWYLWDGQKFVISTYNDAGKVKAVRRDPRHKRRLDISARTAQDGTPRERAANLHRAGRAKGAPRLSGP